MALLITQTSQSEMMHSSSTNIELILGLASETAGQDRAGQSRTGQDRGEQGGGRTGEKDRVWLVHNGEQRGGRGNVWTHSSTMSSSEAQGNGSRTG